MFVTDYSMSSAELAIAAEERGFESMWIPEHSHIPTSRISPFPGGGDLPQMYYDVFDPFAALASAAAVTQKVKLVQQSIKNHLPCLFVFLSISIL